MHLLHVSLCSSGITILFIITILELSHLRNSFEAKYETVQISLDYQDNFAICKQIKNVKNKGYWICIAVRFTSVYKTFKETRYDEFAKR